MRELKQQQQQQQQQPPPPQIQLLSMTDSFRIPDELLLNLTNTTIATSSSPDPIWTLYDNPLFCQFRHHTSRAAHSALQRQLDLARSDALKLKAELQFERHLRRRSESMNRRLAEATAQERARSDAALRLCQDLAREVMEPQRPQPPRREREGPSAVVDRDALGSRWRSTSQRRGQGLGPEAENPHITRGIKGFVEEFPRASRRSSRGRPSSGSDSNIHFLKAQLRLLIRHRNGSSPGPVERSPRPPAYAPQGSQLQKCASWHHASPVLPHHFHDPSFNW